MPLRTKLIWLVVLYFAEGLPFGIVYDLLPVYFRSFDVSLAEIGMLSLLGMPWSLKVFWSPLIDRWGERRHWICFALLAMAALLCSIPALSPRDPGVLMWTILLAFTTLSATQDVAIDAYTIGLIDKGEEGPANSVRVSAYRVALIFAGGALVALATWMSWGSLFYIAAAVFVLLGFAALRTPPLPRLRSDAKQTWAPLWRWLRRPGGWAVLLFILLYKVGDAAMAPMIKPFWIDRGLTPAEIGLVSTTLGIAASILGAVVGGLWIRRHGIFAGLWALGLFQAVSNLGYAGVALSETGREWVYAASILESFCGGLGTAAFLSFLMNICDREHAAVQYALLSAIFGLSRSISGAFSGWGTEALGYAPYFALTFLLAFPAYLFLPFFRTWIQEKGMDGSASATPDSGP